VVFHAATGIDANAIADVQACVRRRLSIGPDDMTAPAALLPLAA